jgi:nicotinate-nucleotide--dimethylbenzimidazole phosphoribosyltransferase
MCRNIAAGGAAISVLARSVGARIVLLDVGVDADLDDLPGIRHRKVRRGSRDLATGPALTREEVLAAIAAGADAVATCHPMPDIVALGEVGIGNTTVASAVAGALTGADPSEVVGRGTGVSDVGLARKRAIVDRAMARLHPSSSATDILKEVGGLDVAALVGVCLSAPRRGCAVVLDGFVSTAAAALAARMDGNACDYYIAGHLAPEPGHRLLLELLSLEPLLSMDMRLGEGTGAVLALPLLDAAGALLRDMATFAEAGVEGPTGGPDAH